MTLLSVIVMLSKVAKKKTFDNMTLSSCFQKLQFFLTILHFQVVIVMLSKVAKNENF